ncbi:MAG: hypothetical protein OCD01_04655 [Fibrobacterales bacterium]
MIRILIFVILLCASVGVAGEYTTKNRFYLEKTEVIEIINDYFSRNDSVYDFESQANDKIVFIKSKNPETKCDISILDKYVEFKCVNESKSSLEVETNAQSIHFELLKEGFANKTREKDVDFPHYLLSVGVGYGEAFSKNDVLNIEVHPLPFMSVSFAGRLISRYYEEKPNFSFYFNLGLTQTKRTLRPYLSIGKNSNNRIAGGLGLRIGIGSTRRVAIDAAYYLPNRYSIGIKIFLITTNYFNK